ncbi:hypothetical protein [Microbacterium indicum]|nr:hypothetical protein [Microbacterium indicum]
MQAGVFHTGFYDGELGFEITVDGCLDALVVALVIRRRRASR